MNGRTVRDTSTGEQTRVYSGPTPPRIRAPYLRVGPTMSEADLACRESFPKHNGVIVDPRRLPTAQRASYGKAILAWTQTTTHPRNTWPGFMDELMAARERKP